MQPELSLAAVVVFPAKESLSLLRGPRRKCTRIRAVGLRCAERGGGVPVKAYRVLFNEFNTLSTASDSVGRLTEMSVVVLSCP